MKEASKKQETRPTVAAVERTETKKRTPAAATIFTNQFTTGDTGRQGRVSGLLRPGAANATPTARLVQMSGFRSAREMQQEIAREREAGALILSKPGDGGGYFLASTRDELEAFHRTLSARALSTLAALKSTRLALDRIDGQTELEGV